MPKMRVDESIVIQEKPSKIYSILSDYHHWQTWSPWLLAEPEAKVTIADSGDFYQWEGQIIGSGQMQITRKSAKHDFLLMDLTFLKPWKSQAKVAFYLKDEGASTQVRWTMDSRLPFFLFWMKKSMEAYISQDYGRGLRLLKDFAETGKTNSSIKFLGLKKHPAMQYLGLQRSISTAEMEQCMGEDFGRLMPLFHQKWKALQAGAPFSIYHKFDVVRKKVIYTAALPLTEIPTDLESDMITGTLPAMQVYSVLHQGPYRHIANAWSAAAMHLRSKQFKPLKKTPPMEVYWNNPKDTSELELKSEILFPAKA